MGVGDRVVLLLVLLLVGDKGGAGVAVGWGQGWCWCCCWLGTRVVLVFVLVATRVMLVAGCETRDHGLFETDFTLRTNPASCRQTEAFPDLFTPSHFIDTVAGPTAFGCSLSPVQQCSSQCRGF